MAKAVHAVETKRKRGRKTKGKVKVRLFENGDKVELQRVNKKGEEVDFASLDGNGDDLYSRELEQRTTGLVTEEEVLEFLRALEGQWGSRRKRRKYVDACMFGDALPVDWKLLLGLKRRDGRVSLYCRRIVSPSGQQFLSCKDASSFLRSYFEGKDSNQPMDQENFIVEQANAVASTSIAGLLDNTDGSCSTLPPLTTSDAHETEVCLMEIDNLPDVQVQDIFECYKCNLIFHERNAYLDHLMSVHEQTTRRYKVGQSIGEGVIIKDGKFECQYCHKVFSERRSYSGHVGVHVRSHGKASKELLMLGSIQKSAESLSVEVSHTRSSKMNALIEIARNSMVEASSARLDSKYTDNSSAPDFKHADNSSPLDSKHANNLSPPDSKHGDNSSPLDLKHTDNSSPPDSKQADIPSPPCMMNNALVGNGNDDTNLSFDPAQIEKGDPKSDRFMDQEVNVGGTGCMVADEKMLNGGDSQVGIIHLKSMCTVVSEHTNSKELGECGNNDVDTGHELGFSKLCDDVANSKGLMGEENLNQIAVTSSSAPFEQSLPYFPDVTDKENGDFHFVRQNLEKVTSFEELGLDEMEPFKYGFVDKQESASLPRISIDLSNDAGTEEQFNSPVGFDTQGIIPDVTGTRQVTTVCVWCRADFKIEAFDAETQSDTIGYMCPTCKHNISGQFNQIHPGGDW